MTSLHDGCWCWRWRPGASRYSRDELILLETTFCGRTDERTQRSCRGQWFDGAVRLLRQAAFHLQHVTRLIVNSFTDFLISQRCQLGSRRRPTATVLTWRQLAAVPCRLARRRNTDTASLSRAGLSLSNQRKCDQRASFRHHWQRDAIDREMEEKRLIRLTWRTDSLTRKDVSHSATSDDVRFIKCITCVSFSVPTKNCDARVNAEHTEDACSSSSRPIKMSCKLLIITVGLSGERAVNVDADDDGDNEICVV